MKSPLDELHGEAPLVVVEDQLPEAHEVRVVDVLHGAELALEPRQAVGADVPEHLERDASPPLPVERVVDHARRALPETTDEVEALGRGPHDPRMVAWRASSRQ